MPEDEAGAREIVREIVEGAAGVIWCVVHF
jgi:hypothetical protein